MASDGRTVRLFVSTKKGMWTLTGDRDRRHWSLEGPEFLGHVINHTVPDPRDGHTLLAAARTGHLGPTVFRSRDLGKTWKEATRPPAFPKARGDAEPRVVDHTFALVPGHASQPDVWYAGTSPEALFRSEDAGDTWTPISGFNESDFASAPPPPPKEGEPPPPGEGTPDGDILHSILIDPRDPSHLYIATSANAGGVFESTDAGTSWTPLNQGCDATFAPDPENMVVGFDPHCLVLHPLAPDQLWQQNHCGIYRLERPSTTWDRIGERMPAEVGDIGFPIALHPRDPDTAFVFPMDGTDVWPRISPGGRPAAFVTRDAGKSWRRLDKGFPTAQAWYTVLRQSMTVDARDPLGVYLAATCGEVWGSTNEGEEWRCLASHLPFVLALEAAEL